MNVEVQRVIRDGEPMFAVVQDGREVSVHRDHASAKSAMYKIVPPPPPAPQPQRAAPIKRRDLDWRMVRTVKSLWMVKNPSDERGEVRSDVIALAGDVDQAARRLGGKWEIVYESRVGFGNAGQKSGAGLLGTLNGQRVVLRGHHDRQGLWRVGGEVATANFYITATPAEKVALEQRDGEWWLI